MAVGGESRKNNDRRTKPRGKSIGQTHAKAGTAEPDRMSKGRPPSRVKPGDPRWPDGGGRGGCQKGRIKPDERGGRGTGKKRRVESLFLSATFRLVCQPVAQCPSCFCSRSSCRRLSVHRLSGPLH